MIRLVLLLALLAPLVRAAPELSPHLAPVLGQLRTQTDARDFKAALVTLAPALAETKPDSFDRFVLLQLEGRLHLNLEQIPAALTSLEAAFRLGEAKSYLEDAERPAHLQTLAQLHYQVANDQPAANRAAGYHRALAYTERWLAALPAPDADALLFSASLRFGLATLDSENPDADGLGAALADARRGLVAKLDPPAQLRLIVIAALQQLDRPAETLPHLELLTRQSPDNATYWRQLVATHLTLADQNADRPALARSHHLRAILTLERAATHNRLNDSRDRLNLVHAYLQVDGHERARRLLADGLRDGSIESTPRSWQSLAGLEQEHGQPAAAADILREAVRRFPDNTDLSLELARLLHVLGQTDEAYRLTLATTARPEKLGQPGRALTYLAYLAYERDDHAAARRHLDQAALHDDARPDDLNRLRAALPPAPPAQ